MLKSIDDIEKCLTLLEELLEPEKEKQSFWKKYFSCCF